VKESRALASERDELLRKSFDLVEQHRMDTSNQHSGHNAHPLDTQTITENLSCVQCAELQARVTKLQSLLLKVNKQMDIVKKQSQADHARAMTGRADVSAMQSPEMIARVTVSNVIWCCVRASFNDQKHIVWLIEDDAKQLGLNMPQLLEQV